MVKKKETKHQRTLKKILKQLIWNPKRSDRTIAKVIGVSQPTVTRGRRLLQRKKLVQFIGVPDFEKIGYEIMAFSFLKKTNENAEELERMIGCKEPEMIVFAIESPTELAIISVHENYTEYTKWISNDGLPKFELSRESVICPTSEIVADIDFSGFEILKDLK